MRIFDPDTRCIPLRQARHRADTVNLLAAFANPAGNLIGLVRRENDGHADSAIEGAEQFRNGDLAIAAQPGKKWRQGPVGRVQVRAEPLGQNTRDVFDQATAGDMRQSLDTP